MAENWILYTDGACQPNPGTGAWSYILFDEHSDKKFLNRGFCLNSEAEDVTNNKMEIKAVIEGLRYFIFEMNKLGENITVVSDSSYVIKAIDKWIDTWEKNNWITYENKQVKNQELWKEISKIKKLIKIECVHIKGHGDNEINNCTDRMAFELAQSVNKIYEIDKSKSYKTKNINNSDIIKFINKTEEGTLE
jgi:ribonuclease HI